jgi:hypothetical protein
MKKFSLLFVVLLTVTLISCKDDEPKVNPLVGEWTLGGIEFFNLPNAYARYEGYTDESLYGESSYLLNIKADQTFERTLLIQSQKIQESGTWEETATKLVLSPDQPVGIPAVFTLEESSTSDSLKLSAQVTFTLLADAIADTAVLESEADLEALFENYGTEIAVNTKHLFSK